MIRREDRDSVAVLRMDHGKANALDVELVTALADELQQIEQAGSHIAVVLTGGGVIFSAGVDLFRYLDGGEDYLERFFAALVRCFHQLFVFPRPVVAAVNGHAVAGGCVMAAAADYRLMTRGKGKIGVPELRVGIPFPVAAIEILRFAASTQHLQELVYLGRTYTAEEAHAVGLVDEIAEPDRLLERAMEVATTLGSMPPGRFDITKRELRAPTLERIARHAPAIDPEVLAGWKAPETHAAIRAYVEETLSKRVKG
jgi:enoyl-CoA hydratase